MALPWSFSLNLCFLFLLFFHGSLPCSSAAAASPLTALVLPVAKDAATKQYVVSLQHKTPLRSDKFVVDLGSGFLWVDCTKDYQSSTFRPVPCGAATCAAAGALGCTGACYSPPRPGCNNNTCSGSPGNTITHLSTSGDLSDDTLVLRSTDGRSSGPPATVTHFVFMCGATLLLPGLAAGSRGMLGLGRTAVAAPHQLASAFGFKRKFALCLSPSAASPGVIFFGDGPYVMQPGVDVSQSMAYTKLLFNPVSTAGAYFAGERSVEYFVKVTSIAVSGKTVPVNTTLLDIHKSKGGTKISTVVPYTRLESSIYSAVEVAFVREAAARNIKRVAAVKPFGACFSTANVANTRTGWAVPEIELFFEGASAAWKIAGANSMVAAGNGVMCLGFVDGGVESRESIVIGGYQLENNLLQFDLESSKMGFSSNLLSKGTSCGNFKL
ncbi:probable aspartic proteinase GIP2 [Nymphaea colorata]|nr:probable aspartic proteinase GIP2 [Nymphaea colorata]